MVLEVESEGRREREFWVNAMCGILEAVVIGELVKMLVGC